MHASPKTPNSTVSDQGRKAAFGAWLGLFIDMFDVYLPIIVLAPAATYFQPATLSPAVSAIVTALIFVATLLGRPIGALVFGYFSDTAGRQRTTVVAVLGFGITTLVIAALPGYDTIGISAVVLLILLRFVDGFFLGGQYTAAIPSALEQCPKHRRGLYGAFIMTGFPLAYCAIALITLLLLTLVPAGGTDSPYTQWGWRVPFLLGGLMALGFAAWYHRSVPESPAWRAAPKSRKSPMLDLLQGSNLRGFVQVFVLMSGVWLAFNMVGAVLPGLLRTRAGLTDVQISTIMIVSYALLAVAYFAVGALSQRFGRRPLLLVAGAVVMIVAPALYGLIVSRFATGAMGLGILTALLVIATVSVFGVISTYINERFRAGVRSSAYGLGYTMAIIIPSFYAFYQAGLAVFLPLSYTPLVLLAVAGLLIVLGATFGPETRDIDLIQTNPVREEQTTNGTHR